MIKLFAVALLLVLQLFDLYQRRLPNRLVAFYAALCPLALLMSGAPTATWLQHGIIAMAGFAVLTILFVLGGMGGGDVKLGTAVLGWAGLPSLLPCLFVIGVSGLILAVLGVVADWLTMRSPAKQQVGRIGRVWRVVLYALSAKRGVPYGVALSAGGMMVLFSYAR